MSCWGASTRRRHAERHADCHPLLQVFISRAQKVAILALGYRLRQPWHLALHLALLAWGWGRDHSSDACAAFLAGAASRAAACPGIPPAAQAAAAAELAIAPLAHFFSDLSGICLLYLLPFPPSSLPMHAEGSALAQCRCVWGMLQVSAGLVLPCMLMLLAESREFAVYSRRHPRGAQQKGHAMRQVYEWVGGATGSGYRVEVPLLALMLLGALWLGMEAAV